MSGQYFEGNLFTKSMDVLNTPQYFLAGFTDGLFSGENPFEAGWEGIKDRHSFIDTLKNHDIPFATPLGIAADILVPGYIGSKIAKLRNAKGIARLKEVMAEEKLIHDNASLSYHLTDAERTLATPATTAEGLADLGARANDATEGVAEAIRAQGGNIPGHSALSGADAAASIPLSGGRTPIVTTDNINRAARVAGQAATASNAQGFGIAPLRAAVRGVHNIRQAVGDRLQNTFGEGFEIFKNNMVRNVHDALNRSPLFDGVGDVMSSAIDRTQRFTKHMRAVYASKADKIVEKIGANPEDHKIWWRLSNGLNLNAEQISALAANSERATRIREAVDMTRRHFAEDFALKQSLGIREVLGAHTQAVRRLTGDQRGKLYAYLNNSEMMQEAAQKFAAGHLSIDESRVFSLAKNILDEGGTIDELSQAVVVPLREVQNYLPMRYTKLHRKKLEEEAFKRAKDLELQMRGLSDPAAINQLALDRARTWANRGRVPRNSQQWLDQYNTNYQNLARLVRQGRMPQFASQAAMEQRATRMTDLWAARTVVRESDPRFATAVNNEYRRIIYDVERKAKRIAQAELSDPDEIVSGFQHSRAMPLGNMTEEAITELEKQIVMHPQELLYHHSSSSGLAIGAAKGFGPTANLWHTIRKNYLLNHGITDEFRPESMSPGVRSGLDFLDRLHKLATGNAKMPFDKANALASNLADSMFLGPRTVFVQVMNLANSAAHAGAANSFASMAEAMTNPEFRRIGARIAGVLPNLEDTTSQASKFQKMMDKLSFIYKGIKQSDTLMRSQSSIAGILDSIGRESEILKHVSAGRIEKARELVSRFKLDYNTDISYLLNGGKIKHADLMRVAEIASTKANFSNDLLSTQMAFNTPAGKFFLKFKQFAAHQTNFITGMTNRFKKTKDPTEILRYATVFGWTYGHLEPLLNLFKNKKTNVKEKNDAMSKIQGMLTMGFLGYMGDAALALSSESEALGLGVVTGPIPNAALKAKSTLWHLTPFAWDPEKAIQSGPAIIRQGKNLWENSTQ